MKSVLFVLETSGASGQDNNRALVYQSSFEQAGIAVTYLGQEPQHPAWALYSKAWLADQVRRSLEYKVYAGLKFKAIRTLNHWRTVRAAQRADAVFLIKVSSLALVRKIRASSRARLVYDLGDALWLPAFSSTYGHLREIIQSVDAVTCDNRYGADYARQFCSEVYQWEPYPQIEMFDRMRRAKPSARGNPLTIGWLGSPRTLYNLYSVWEALEEVFKKHPQLHLNVVGAGTDPLLLPPFEHVRFTARPYYSNAEMFNEVLDMDIGIFPMFDVENSQVRGIMKALIYMSGGAAVVCSPRGVCADLIKDGENGFLAEGRNEWVEKLDQLIQNAPLRQAFVDRALPMVRERHSLKKCFNDLRAFLKV